MSDKEISELNYGVSVENLLYDLSQHESSDIGEFDVYGEDEQGREGCASVDITLLASDALKVIGTLKAEHTELLEKFNFKQYLTEQIVALQKQRDVLIAENVALREIIERLIGQYSAAGYHAVQNSLNPAQSLLYDAMQVLKQPATDAYLNSVRAEAIPEGYVLVPQKMHLSADAMESLCFHCGDGGFAFGDFTDGLLWVGDIENDGGTKTYGLNIATAEYPEEGSANISEFAAQLRAGKDGE